MSAPYSFPSFTELSERKAIIDPLISGGLQFYILKFAMDHPTSDLNVNVQIDKACAQAHVFTAAKVLKQAKAERP